jgi:heme-degrading monooxygenase HmoA
MTTDERVGQVAVIFASRLTGDDPAGYAAAGAAMEQAAAALPGYRGIMSCRSPEGDGITVSYWADDAAARAWRDDPDHARIRDRGRAVWYDRYELVVAQVTRDYRWTKS